MGDADGIDSLTATIGRYNDAWNAQDSTRSCPCTRPLVKRKDVYSDSVSILRQVGLLD